MADPIPQGLHSVTPHLVIRDCDKALAFYQKAFGAEILGTSPGPGGKLMHATFKIGDSVLMAADEFPEMGNTTTQSPATAGTTTCVLNIYGPGVDARYQRAIDAGARSLMAPADMFWGDRYCQVADPFGHVWALGTHVEDVSPEQIAERFQKWMAESGGPGQDT